MSYSLPTFTNDFYQTLKPVAVIDKQRAYITVPAFSLDFEWKGASTIRAEYQYEATKKFVLGRIPSQPENLNYVLCIKYRIGNEVFRYKIWYDTEEDVIDWVPAYDSQIIYPHFTLEFWSLNENEESIALEDDTVFPLSIRHVRQQLTDNDTFSEDDASELVTELGNTNVYPTTTPPTLAEAFPLSIPASDQNLIGYYEGSSLTAGYLDTWTPTRTLFESGYSPEMGTTEWNTPGLPGLVSTEESSISNRNYLALNGAAYYATNGDNFNPFQVIDGGDGQVYGILDENGKAVFVLASSMAVSTGYYQTYWVALIRQKAWQDDSLLYRNVNVEDTPLQDILQKGTIPNLRYGSNSLGIDNEDASLDKWFIVEAWYDDNNFHRHLKVIDLKTGESTEITGNSDSSPFLLGSLILGDASANIDVAALAIYCSLEVSGDNVMPEAQMTLIEQYLQNTYGGNMGLPLIYTEEQNGISN